jgi:hypothetical protein
LDVPDGGFDIASVQDIRTGEAVTWEHRGATLRLRPRDWTDVRTSGVTIFKVTTAGRRLVTSTTVSLDDEPVSLPIQSEVTWPSTITVELDAATTISGLLLTRPEWGAVTQGGYAAPPSERISTLHLIDGEDGTRLTSTVLPHQRGTVQVELPRSRTTSRLLVQIDGNHSGTPRLGVSGMDVIAGRADA